MPHLPIYIFDLGGVLIRLDVGRCMRAFEALMGEENMRNHLLVHPQQHRRNPQLVTVFHAFKHELYTNY